MATKPTKPSTENLFTPSAIKLFGREFRGLSVNQPLDGESPLGKRARIPSQQVQQQLSKNKGTGKFQGDLSGHSGRFPWMIPTGKTTPASPGFMALLTRVSITSCLGRRYFWSMDPEKMLRTILHRPECRGCRQGLEICERYQDVGGRRQGRVDVHRYRVGTDEGNPAAAHLRGRGGDCPERGRRITRRGRRARCSGVQRCRRRTRRGRRPRRGDHAGYPSQQMSVVPVVTAARPALMARSAKPKSECAPSPATQLSRPPGMTG